MFGTLLMIYKYQEMVKMLVGRPSQRQAHERFPNSRLLIRGRGLNKESWVDVEMEVGLTSFVDVQVSVVGNNSSLFLHRPTWACWTALAHLALSH